MNRVKTKYMYCGEEGDTDDVFWAGDRRVQIFGFYISDKKDLHKEITHRTQARWLN